MDPYTIEILSPDGTSLTVSAERLNALVLLGLAQLDNELVNLEWDEDGRVDALATQVTGERISAFLYPPSPDDDIPF